MQPVKSKGKAEGSFGSRHTTTNHGSQLRSRCWFYVGKKTGEPAENPSKRGIDQVIMLKKYILFFKAEAGGMLGLLLGASIITVIEFLDFLFSLFAIKYFKWDKNVYRLQWMHHYLALSGPLYTTQGFKREASVTFHTLFIIL